LITYGYFLVFLTFGFKEFEGLEVVLPKSILTVFVLLEFSCLAIVYFLGGDCLGLAGGFGVVRPLLRS